MCGKNPAAMIKDFVPVATAVVAVKNLKIISFGPRPTNFLACNAPIKQLYNLGVEIEENSELDLFEAFNKHAGDERIPAVVEDMAKELGEGNLKPEILPKLAQYEITLLDWIEAHKGSRKYVTLTGKCWPAFQTQFGFVPCYVNSRLTKMGIIDIFVICFRCLCLRSFCFCWLRSYRLHSAETEAFFSEQRDCSHSFCRDTASMWE